MSQDKHLARIDAAREAAAKFIDPLDDPFKGVHAEASAALDRTRIRQKEQLTQIIQETIDAEWNWQIINVMQQMEDLKVALAEARADVARMDHLEAEAVNDSGNVLFRRNFPITRKAVDAAIQKEKL